MEVVQNRSRLASREIKRYRASRDRTMSCVWWKSPDLNSSSVPFPRFLVPPPHPTHRGRPSTQSPFPRRHCSIIIPCLLISWQSGPRPASSPAFTRCPTLPCALMDTPTKRLRGSRERNPQQHLQLRKKNIQPSEITRGQAIRSRMSIFQFYCWCLLVS